MQDYPKHLTELVVVDNRSVDGTLHVLQEVAERMRKQGDRITVLENDKTSLASGWNLAIRNTNADFVCRIDAHAELAINYLRLGIETISCEGMQHCVCVGGVLESRGRGVGLSDAIAAAMSCPFGVGNSAFRVGVRGSHPIETDTAVYGVYRRAPIATDDMPFDESLDRNQDIALHHLLRRRGWTFFTNPQMRAAYYVRDALKPFLRKGFVDGYWVIRSGRFYARHIVPLMFVIYLGIAIALATTLGLCVWVPLFVYALFAVAYSMLYGKSIPAKLVLPLLFYSLHVSYGTGSLVALPRYASNVLLRLCRMVFFWKN
ncbi:Glycosyl transferase family 2 [Rosistilla oblonga]|nr:Glycosyl transferase family 2 [Rosistilla oblonga]